MLREFLWESCILRNYKEALQADHLETDLGMVNK